MVILDADHARTRADVIDTAWVGGDLLPAFAGSFVTIKDSLRTAGMQIVGPEYGDLSTIEFARRIEAVLGGFCAPPGYE